MDDAYMQRIVKTSKLVSGLLCLAALASNSQAETKTTVSVAGKIAYDSNVMLQDEGSLVAGQTEPTAPANADALVAVLNATVATTVTEGEASARISYSPEATVYSGFSDESHVDQCFTFSATSKGEYHRFAGTFSARIVDGDDQGPYYNEVGGGPAIGGVPVRNRRDQTILKGDASIVHDFANETFLRLVASGSDQNFQMEMRNDAFYSNYSDRSEITTGLEYGWKPSKDLTVFLGGHIGFQRSIDRNGVHLNYTSNYSRVLLGAEGKLGSKLKISATFGPDFRRYKEGIRSGLDPKRTDLYTNTALTWTPVSSDSFSVAWKRYLAVGGGGRSAYVDSTYSTAWKHTFSSVWSSSLDATLFDADYKDFLSAARVDRIFNVGATVSAKLDAKTKLDFTLLRDWSSDAGAQAPGRVYHRWYVQVGAAYQF